MLNNEALKEKICSFDCSLEELCDFSRHRGQRKTDYFKKYFNIETVSRCFELYFEGKLTHEYVSEWAYAYALILKGYPKFSFERDYNKPLMRKDLIEILILDILDCVTEYSYDAATLGEDPDDLRYWQDVLTILDRIYKERREWQPYYCFDEDLDDDGVSCDSDTLLISFVNHKTKEFYRAWSDSYCYTDMDIKAVRLSNDAYYDKIDKLLSDGYIELGEESDENTDDFE